MKISYTWLKDFIETGLEPVKLGMILTNIGLEVEGIEEYTEIKGGMKGLIIGEVVSCQKHPNADKLSVTTVDIGNEQPLNIVCGAPNVATGQKVVVATIGTELYMEEKSFTIQKTKIRGVESEGMICAEDEIGLGVHHNGILVVNADARPGTPAAEYFNISNDTVFEIGLTPNRIDAASHFGVARDLAAFLSGSKPVDLKKPYLVDISQDDSSMRIDVSIEDVTGCRRFTGVTITNVKIGPSPKWMQNRLRAIELSPINNVVDITNYVMHELGQPLHAYDADKLQQNKIIVKRLKEGTKFTTLDGIERSLTENDVMVCDGKEPVCIAGVFGGLLSGVTDQTKNVFLESAYFDPVFVRKTAHHHGLNTDSSFRFERGVDPRGTFIALKRAAALTKEIAGGIISSEFIDVHPAPIEPWTVELLYSHIDRLIGKTIDRTLIKSILSRLEIEIAHETIDKLIVQVPPYRVDVTREADVIEEILRIYGYDNIEFSTKLKISVSPVIKPDNELWVDQISEYLSHSGFFEIMSNSLTKKEYYNGLSCFSAEKLVPILNPLSADLNVMRQTLLFGGLETISRNINHKNPNLRLYEFGRVYSLINSDVSNFSNFTEQPVFGLFITGDMYEQSWAVKSSPSNFFQLKAYYTNILQKLGIDIGQFSVGQLNSGNEIFSDGLEYLLKDKRIILAGSVQKNLLAKFEIDQEVFFAELLWDDLLKQVESKRTFTDLPKFPEVRRDLALLIDNSVQYQQIEKLAFQAGGKLLKRIGMFDYYKGGNIPAGKKSYAISFFLQDLTKTLTDKEIDRIMKKITETLVNNLDAELR
jgi:phenylalanyl-tRNA synthetase beta chain